MARERGADPKTRITDRKHARQTTSESIGDYWDYSTEPDPLGSTPLKEQISQQGPEENPM